VFGRNPRSGTDANGTAPSGAESGAKLVQCVRDLSSIPGLKEKFFLFSDLNLGNETALGGETCASKLGAKPPGSLWTAPQPG